MNYQDFLLMKSMVILKRFKFLIKLQPLQFKKMKPEEKLLDIKNNPPNFSVEFFKEQKNINYINCFSDEGDGQMEKIKYKY